MNKIYLIMWNGRDVDSDIWDSYPCYDQGFFLNKQKAQDCADYLNKTSDFDYDYEAEETPNYSILMVELHRDLQ